MYFDADKNDHGLPYNPIKALFVPRPIGWISPQRNLPSIAAIDLAQYLGQRQHADPKRHQGNAVE